MYVWKNIRAKTGRLYPILFLATAAAAFAFYSFFEFPCPREDVVGMYADTSNGYQGQPSLLMLFENSDVAYICINEDHHVEITTGAWEYDGAEGGIKVQIGGDTYIFLTTRTLSTGLKVHIHPLDMADWDKIF